MYLFCHSTRPLTLWGQYLLSGPVKPLPSAVKNMYLVYIILYSKGDQVLDQ